MINPDTGRFSKRYTFDSLRLVVFSTFGDWLSEARYRLRLLEEKLQWLQGRCDHIAQDVNWRHCRRLPR